MSIFSSIGSAVKSAYNTVKSGISSALSSISGKNNTAYASNAPVFGSADYMRQTASQGSAYGPGQAPTTGASGSWTNTLSAGQLSPGLNSGLASSGINSGGGAGSGSYGPQLPVNISAGRVSSSSGSSGSTLDLSGFNPAAFTSPTTISAKTMGAQTSGLSGAGLQTTGGSVGTPISLASAPTSVNPGSIDNTRLAGTVSGYKQYNPKTGQFDDVAQTQQGQTLDAKVQKELDILKKYMPEKASVFEDPQVIEARNKRQQLQQALQVPTAELNAIVAKQNQDLLQLRQTGSQEGVTEAVYGGQQNAINYNAAIRALPLQASISSIQGDLKLAQDYLTELTQIKQDQINKQYEYNKAQFDAIKGVITKEDERAYQEITTKNDRKYKEQQDLIKYQAELTRNALAQKAPTNVINRINSADSIQDAIMAAGEYGGDVKDAISIQNAKLQNEKLTQEIAANKPVTGEYANIINGAAGLVPSTKKQQVKQNIANSLASGDYKTAYAEISNAVSDGLTGTNKTKFDDARTDLEVLSNVRTAIKNYADANGDMGLLKGTEEEIKRKLGIDTPKASTLAVQLWREFQTYRSNMTGAAFTPAESRDYAAVNPTLGKSLNLNLSVIDGAMNQLGNRVTSTVKSRIPESQKIYEKAYGSSSDSQQTKTINISGKDYVVGQVYQDASGAKWVVDSNGKWTTQ